MEIIEKHSKRYNEDKIFPKDSKSLLLTYECTALLADNCYDYYFDMSRNLVWISTGMSFGLVSY